MRPSSTRPFAFLVLFALAGIALAQPTPEPPPTAAELFELTLDEQGLEAALQALSAAIADSTEPHAIDAYELGLGLPARLVVAHRREEALELIKILEPLFGDMPRYWQELGLAHLRCGHTDPARRALARAADGAGTRPDLTWMLEHLDDLADLARRQAAAEDSLVPGESTGLQGPYLGQRPPGRIPEPFAPGILSTTAHEYHVSFAPDGREIVFSRGGVGSLVSRWTTDGWTVPEVVHLIDADHLTEEANFTPDGQAILFCGRAEIRRPRMLYRAERVTGGWGAPTRLFPGMYPTASLDGTLYYTTEGEGRDHGVIVRRARTGDGYGEPVVVPGEGINTEFADAHPWIAPLGDLLLFDTYRDPGMGLHVSFRGADGAWCPAISLQDAIGVPPVGQPALSHDGKYLFFSLAGDVYWVDAGFLEELRPD